MNYTWYNYRVSRESDNWYKIATRDLKYAHDNFSMGNYPLSIEKCHDSLEKLLKAIISFNGNKVQKIHDLLRLTSEALIDNLQNDIKVVLDDMDSCYFTLRYPVDIDEVEEDFGKEKAEEILKETNRIFKWLEKKIK